MCGDVLCVQSLRLLAFLEMDQVFSMTIKEATTLFLWVLVRTALFLCNEIYETKNMAAYFHMTVFSQILLFNDTGVVIGLHL